MLSKKVSYHDRSLATPTRLIAVREGVLWLLIYLPHDISKEEFVPLLREVGSG